MTDMLFQGWADIARTVCVGVLAYAALILLLRGSGKRTLAKLNAFDLVVTVAIGSTFATVLLSEQSSLAEGVAAFATLIALQWLVTFASVRSRRIADLVRSEPSLLMRKGEVCHAALKRERVTRDELDAVVRASAIRDPAKVEAVVLESDGSFSVM